MQIRAETYIGHSGVEMLRRFYLDSREIEVRDTLDQWYGCDYRYFKVKGGDGNLYVLRHDEATAYWHLIMFQSQESHGLPEDPPQ